MKYLIYARVSQKGSNWHGTDTSISTQIAACKDFVIKKDPSAKFEIASDEFYTGKNTKRPEFERIMSKMNFDCLVVFHLDRLTRSLIDATPIFEKLRDAGKGFISIQQNLDLFTAGGRAMLYMLIVFAQFEREMNSERTKAKMIAICREGGIPYGIPPFGYVRKKGTNILQQDKIKASVVKDIIKSYADGVSTDQLLRKHIDIIKSKNTIQKILSNPIYYGIIEYDNKQYQGKHKPIVTKEAFLRANSRLPKVKTGPRLNARKYPYFLSGLVKCHCGRYMTNYSVLKKGKHYFYYKCTDQLCRETVNAEKLDKLVIDELKRLPFEKKEITVMLNELQRIRNEQAKQTDPELMLLDNQIKELTEKQTNITNAFLNGLVTPDNKFYWNEQLAKTNNELSSCNERKKQILDYQASIERESPEKIVKRMKYYSNLLSNTPSEEDIRNALLARVDSVTSTMEKRFRLNMVMTNRQEWLPHKDSNLN